MKQFLVKCQKVDFGGGVVIAGDLRLRKATFQVSKQTINEQADSLPHCIYRELSDIFSDKTLQVEIGSHVSYVWDENAVRIISSEPFLEQLYATSHCEKINLDVVLTLKNIKFNKDGTTTTYMAKHAKTDSMRIGAPTANKSFLSSIIRKPQFSIVWKGFYFSNWSSAYYFHDDDFSLETELELAITLSTDECGCLSSLKLKDLTDVNNKILRERIGPDLSIVPCTGKTVPCHRAFLIAHSPAFDGLVKGTFGDPKSNFLKMPELSEAGVQALVDYMYLGETGKPEENCVLALELYVAAHRYEVTGLKEFMRKLLITKEDNWYTVDMLMKFYTFVKNKEGDEDLKNIAVRLIKANFKTIQQSEHYRNFYKDDPEGAMELVSLLVE